MFIFHYIFDAAAWVFLALNVIVLALEVSVHAITQNLSIDWGAIFHFKPK